MCTLRNFPHLTDHCIEWARDQFELLFAKLGKSAHAYVASPEAFEADKRIKGSSEAGAAVFDIRSLTSFQRAARDRTIGGAAQLAFDIFHYLFRDRILDLQAAFPHDARMIDKDTGVDKGPFWSEKKRYPTVVTFNPDDESHVQFMISTTLLSAVALGLIPPKKESDVAWLKEYRSKEWIMGVMSSLSPPPYIRTPVIGEGIEGAAKVSSEDIDAMFNGLFSDLRSISSGIALPSFDVADFEKDDDLNFHIAFVTAAANLRCDNYAIARTDFQSCKVIAGRIIAAIATTTAAVCGLVIFELFKLVHDMPLESYRNRTLNLAVNSYTSFEQDPPLRFKTYEESVAFDETELPEEGAYDEKGILKPEFYRKESKLAYPENHSVWDKVDVSGAWTLKEFASALQTEHKLEITQWDFICGRKKDLDEEKKEVIKDVTTRVFPPEPILDYGLIPSLDLSKAQATMALMKVPAAKPVQKYIALWEKCKESGMIPPQPAPRADEITENSTVRQILELMAARADALEAEGKVDTKAISGLAGRRFWVIPGDETPTCVHSESGDAIFKLASLRVTF